MRPLQKVNFTSVCVYDHLMANKLKNQRMPKLEKKIIFNNKKLPNLPQITYVNNINNIQAHSSNLSPLKWLKVEKYIVNLLSPHTVYHSPSL